MDRHISKLLAICIIACGAAASRPDVGNEAQSSSKNVVSIGTAETLQPPYQTLQQTDAYEEREYEEGAAYLSSGLSIISAPQDFRMWTQRHHVAVQATT